jgi:hypothetical protein
MGMIPTNEIRSGNWVRRPAPYNQCGQIAQTENTISVLHHGKRFFHYAFQLQPISLSSHILESVGCTSMSNDTYHLVMDQYHFMLCLQETGNITVWQSQPSKSLQLGEVKYLHQLQNLLFKLTELELSIDREALESEDMDQHTAMITA